MKQSYHIISLRTIRYNDRHNILTAYSLEGGTVAFLTPAGQGREASRRRALLMPLSLIECVGDRRPGHEIMVMHEPQATAALSSLRSNPIKSSVAIFLAEVLTAILREGVPDEHLFKYIEESVRLLDRLPQSRCANFHVCFLYRLGHYLGIRPDATGYREGMVFDLLDSRFRQTPPLHGRFLAPAESAAVAALDRMNFRNMHFFAMSRRERNALLDGILDYYSTHYASLTSLRSLDVLRAVF